MCGRYTLTHAVTDLGRIFDFEERPNLPPRYNIAPTQPVAAVRRRDAGRELVSLRWGLVPFWAETPGGPPLINARAESVNGKPSFRHAMRGRRCLLPADGFYEWEKRPDGSKQPYRIVRPDRGVFAFAGLWDVWKPKDGPGEPLETTTIVTTTANASLAFLHDRMPVILGPSDWDAWLDPQTTADVAAGLLRPCPDDWLEAYPVDRRVNNVRNDDEGCIAPLTEPPRLL
jgi:putative SOS response-associated peptidase YedK